MAYKGMQHILKQMHVPARVCMQCSPALSGAQQRSPAASRADMVCSIPHTVRNAPSGEQQLPPWATGACTRLGMPPAVNSRPVVCT